MGPPSKLFEVGGGLRGGIGPSRMGPPSKLSWHHGSRGPVAEPPPAQARCGCGEGLQRPPAGAVAPRQHAHAGHAVPRLRRPSPSPRCTGDQRPQGPAAAAGRQRPHRLPAPGHQHGQAATRHQHGQAATRHPAPYSSDVSSGGGSPTDALMPQPMPQLVRNGEPFVTAPSLLLIPSALLRSTQAYPSWVRSLSEPVSHMVGGVGVRPADCPACNCDAEGLRSSRTTACSPTSEKLPGAQL
eukprot:366077-Chlamydomonas_euryale.AAC.2